MRRDGWARRRMFRGYCQLVRGDLEPRLKRVQALPEMQHDQWIVMNRIAKLFRANADLISGRRG